MSKPDLDLKGPRVLLRTWRDSDRAPFAALNADPAVMEHLAGPVSAEDSDAIVGRIEAIFEAHGFGFWALEVPGVTEFAGFVGLGVPRFAASFTPCVEVGWRLARDYWGKGYAVEAASVALRAAFGPLGLSDVVAYTVPDNARSRRVMDRLGMRHRPEHDFDHPSLAADHPLHRHVLYGITRAEWLTSAARQTVASQGC